jgi:hypothetical protein
MVVVASKARPAGMAFGWGEIAESRWCTLGAYLMHAAGGIAFCLIGTHLPLPTID